ncbi:hypothetical protein [Nonomuraea sp. NPDC049400]|uniref:phosphotransferase-like protein n=1 Tax=Nonomuraea sp. NPDC049400 TaxID=3364352 RepID=UPI0037BDC197
MSLGGGGTARSGRTDRMTSAPQLDEPVHAHGCYDLEVDTSVQGPADIAKLIVAALVEPPVVSAFDQLRTRKSGGQPVQADGPTDSK